ncbi:cytidylate kinase [Paenibacillus sp. 598K]|uniref:(d)CMP kinase n=1 Tax=Paenibacillus sp. 598K TaxID=1117987 RepID=UPI000FFAF4A9|nr:(d)CMP kinase [Paenibacillus sp. 598K]GBF72745.1 cytidylate kinase [Paenibacillus sp. 598K]
MSTQHQDGHDRINIAIDGPAGAGKSTVARKVAERLGYIYIDTGAMYRAVTLGIRRAGVDADDHAKVAEAAASFDIVITNDGGKQEVVLDGKVVTEEIRTREVNLLVSKISAIPAVRQLLVDKQRQLALVRGVVMDGRDIGTKVLPNADLKIFLTASVDIRAERRYQESGNSQQITLAQLRQEIAARDKMDQERAVSPLTRAADALVVDSSDLTIEQVVEHIIELGRTKLAGAK